MQHNADYFAQQAQSLALKANSWTTTSMETQAQLANAYAILALQARIAERGPQAPTGDELLRAEIQRQRAVAAPAKQSLAMELATQGINL